MLNAIPLLVICGKYIGKNVRASITKTVVELIRNFVRLRVYCASIV